MRKAGEAVRLYKLWFSGMIGLIDSNFKHLSVFASFSIHLTYRKQ